MTNTEATDSVVVVDASVSVAISSFYVDEESIMTCLNGDTVLSQPLILTVAITPANQIKLIIAGVPHIEEH